MRKVFSIIPLCIVILLATFLRFYDLGNNPPGLYMDEVSIGYNAYTILTKGTDEHNEKYPLMFKGFGEYKMPVYIYLTAVSEYVFGKTEFAVRFTSSLSGVITVLIFYFFIQVLLKISSVSFSTNLKKYLPLVATSILAISPWHIHFSRGGFEANTALLFYLCALYVGVLFIQKHSFKLLVLCCFLASVTLYTYFAYRIITLLTFAILILYLWKKNHLSKKELGIAIGSFLFFVLPLVYSSSASGLARFSQTSAFSEYHIKNIWEILYLYPLAYLKNYFSYFSLSFLFVTGDGIGRHQMPWFGLLPKWEIIFLFTGIWYLLKSKKSFATYLIFGLILVSPVAAALAIPSPQSLRSLSLVLPLSLIVGVGLIVALSTQKKRIRLLVYLILVFGIIESIFFVHHYVGHYPRVNQLDWGGGYKSIVQKASGQKNAVFLLDGSLPYSSIYFKFYNHALPCIIESQVSAPLISEKRIIRIAGKKNLPNQTTLIETIRLPYNVDNEIFADFGEVRACY